MVIRLVYVYPSLRVEAVEAAGRSCTVTVPMSQLEKLTNGEGLLWYTVTALIVQFAKICESRLMC